MASKKKRYTLKEIRKIKGKKDMEKFNKITDKEIKVQILADLDTPSLTENELKEF